MWTISYIEIYFDYKGAKELIPLKNEFERKHYFWLQKNLTKTLYNSEIFVNQSHFLVYTGFQLTFPR